MTTRLLPSLLACLFAAACTSATGDKDDTAADDTANADDTGDTAVETDADGDGYPAGEDCDDADDAVNPAATEACDGVDNDCDGDTDEDGATGGTAWYEDADRDGAGNAAVSVTACAQPALYVADDSDCDDADPANFPGNPEVCDGGDNDCDLEADEADAVDAATWYADLDGDGFGDPDASAVSCAGGEGWVADATDCDDEDATIYTGAPEMCGDIDHDCDGAVNEDTSIDVRTFYADADADGFGDASFTADACDAPEGYVEDATDCDDADDTRFPGADEVCDEVDNDCDDAVDVGADGRDVCDTGGTGGIFDGTFAGEWEELATSMDSPFSYQAYHPSGTLLYNMYNNPGSAYDPETDEWTRLSTYAPYARIWNAMAPYEGQLYSVMNSHVYRYTPDDDSWETLTSISGSDDYNMTESDEDGNIYGYTADGSIVIYSAVGGGVEYVSTGLGSEYETRLGWDPTTRGLYFGAFYTPNLYRYDVDSGEITEVTSIPEPQLNDIFCSDRSGHIYAAGDSSGTTMWQYTTATDTWAPLPDLPSDHGNNWHCTVSEDGWLYVGADSNRFYRLELY